MAAEINVPSEQFFQKEVNSTEQMISQTAVSETETEAETIVNEIEVITPPDLVENIRHDIYDSTQTFWEIDENNQTNDPEAYALNVDTKMISNLQVGQTFDFYIPELNQTFQTNINTTKNSSNGTHIFKGEIKDGSFGENVSIVRGKNMTFITVATLQGVFSASIDNATGKTLLQSEASLNKNLREGDGVYIEQPETEPPVDG
ncbi:MAG: hypothetical protein KZQ64_15040 [gamma proteobacterium symbiont of Bathyaustriella thionipta]|nr:hypothetical protein [gamma proteobacterium symbiont of Bathyaustriella thionipta]MCU7950259.1 hypothetical protein [gamma proteobacterium symbiont of Bathyaustriella thionipta]MCU7954684.1 hypothetical protein [gamma proteobacterium symbiont of Bathyaustriella thionipta]MCU7956819.1 hypothetical protein [gamma proteobacterium symbiont of Bathyaustriella thionipta]MCU7965832.1 hypothetical protein [gamma proteobacterium symbiont of Bathyaustriella thionipta]